MDIALSRRAAKALASRYMTKELSFSERQAFVRAVEQAKDFASLPERYQQMIETAEAERKKGNSRH